MQLGMIGLGRMGANLVRRLTKDGHECVVYDINPAVVKKLEGLKVLAASSIPDLVSKLARPRAVWVMVPAGVVGRMVEELASHMTPDDIIVDGGNSYYRDDIERAASLKKRGVHYLDCGTSGGVWGLERGYCLMIGGQSEAVQRLEPIFRSIAPGVDGAPRTAGRTGPPAPAERGYLHCGPSGAGHFVKMVHNGVEYGMMAAIAEGLNILHHANVGKQRRTTDAETTPLQHPEYYQYDLNVADVAEVWRRGSVVASWLLDLTAASLHESPDLSSFHGRVSDSGEGRWTVIAAIDESAPAPVISTALYDRFSSRGEADFADRALSAMRYAFGGHDEKPAAAAGGSQ
jgi:6-phosphogluconate dehydrogenase